jgi:hypothetical protein
MAKVLKICDLFNVNRYVVPRPEEMQYNLNMLRNEIHDKIEFLNEAENSITTFIRERSGDVRYKKI